MSIGGKAHLEPSTSKVYSYDVAHSSFDNMPEMALSLARYGLVAAAVTKDSMSCPPTPLPKNTGNINILRTVPFHLRMD